MMHGTAVLLSISFVHASLAQMGCFSSPAEICFLGELGRGRARALVSSPALRFLVRPHEFRDAAPDICQLRSRRTAQAARRRGREL
jgi:hypothetical protein